jgi:iron complex transport system substrate-binding protein
VPEMVEIAGGRDELATPAASSQRISWQEVVDYAPEALVLIPCSLSLERVANEFELLRGFPDWESLPAVRSRQVFAGHTHLFSQSGMRIVDGIEALARMLHPEVFVEPIPAGQALKQSPDGLRLEPYR